MSDGIPELITITSPLEASIPIRVGRYLNFPIIFASRSFEMFIIVLLLKVQILYHGITEIRMIFLSRDCPIDI
jgi:hypothetical protein